MRRILAAIVGFADPSLHTAHRRCCDCDSPHLAAIVRLRLSQMRTMLAGLIRTMAFFVHLWLV
jgi:hypothetical protein